jgi:transposase InsO family protein
MRCLENWGLTTDLKALVAESINTYNRIRPHLSLGMKTPEEVHKKACCEWQPA